MNQIAKCSLATRAEEISLDDFIKERNLFGTSGEQHTKIIMDATNVEDCNFDNVIDLDNIPTENEDESLEITCNDNLQNAHSQRNSLKIENNFHESASKRYQAGRDIQGQRGSNFYMNHKAPPSPVTVSKPKRRRRHFRNRYKKKYAKDHLYNHSSDGMNQSYRFITYSHYNKSLRTTLNVRPQNLYIEASTSNWQRGVNRQYSIARNLNLEEQNHRNFDSSPQTDALKFLEYVGGSVYGSKNLPKYDMRIQKEIHALQKKPMLFRCPSGEVISSDGPGIKNFCLIPSSTGITLNQRFA